MTHVVREETTLDEARVFLAAEVDIRRPRLRGEGRPVPRARCSTCWSRCQRDGGPIFRFDQTLELTLPPDTREELSRTWLPIVREFELADRALPRQDRGARQGHRADGDGRSTTSRCPTSSPSGSPPRSSATCASRRRTARPGDRLGDPGPARLPAGGLALLPGRRVPGGEGGDAPACPGSRWATRCAGATARSSPGTPPSLIRPTPDGALSADDRLLARATRARASTSS